MVTPPPPDVVSVGYDITGEQCGARVDLDRDRLNSET